MDKFLAEILGLFAAEGHLSDKYICIWGNLHEETEYYDMHVIYLRRNLRLI